MTDQIPLIFPAWLLYVFGAAGAGVVLLGFAAVGTAVARRWHSTKRLGFLTTLGAVAVICAAMLTMMAARALTTVPHDDPVTAAVRLGRSISALMNATGPAVPAALLGAAAWLFAWRQGHRHPGRSDAPPPGPSDTPSSRPRS